MWECAACKSAYLGPRPTPGSIHRAYSEYYTHREVTLRAPITALRGVRKFRRLLVNGYLQRTFGFDGEPGTKLGWLMYAFPNARARLHHEYRNLPPLPRSGGRLLDIGSGDGDFLVRAARIGWDVTGVEPDPKAAELSRSNGLRVLTGGLEAIDSSCSFDVITMNHVIEHVHDPVATLKRCWSLLRPGGLIWLETPNSQSYGHTVFQESWRGLEAPRHLVLFSEFSLQQALREVGFEDLRSAPRHDPSSDMYRASYVSIGGGSPLPLRIRALALYARFRQFLAPHQREVLTLTARRPR
jgi:2-polyprenyl-3-methyl-5-hydroxy-6-metoxy-1,4-benzoquinol methylase